MSSEWRIGEICDINIRNLSKDDNFEYVNYLDTSNLNEGIISDLQYLKVGIDKIPSRAKRKVKINDILISTVRPIQKHYGILKKVEKNMIASTGFAVLTPKEKFVNPEYLYRFLTQNRITILLQSIAESSTTAYPSIKPSVISDLEIKLPPVNEQKAIAKILSSLDEKIELNNKINKTLEKIAQTIFKHWFIDFEFSDENGGPYKSSGGEMVESELGIIPKGWVVGALGDIINITSGKRPVKKSDIANEDFKIPLVGASKVMGYSENYNFNEPVLIIGRVGTHGIVQKFDDKIWASDNTLVIKSDKYEYVHQILKSIDYSSLNVGSTQPLITQTDIKNYEIVLPNSSTLENYESLIGKIFNTYSNYIKENEALSQLRDTLLPKLMSGEIRVPIEDDNLS